MKKLLLCGATGFIGRNFLNRLAEKKEYEIYATYHEKTPPELERDAPGVRFVRANLTNREPIRRIMRGMDIVIQAAATTSGAKEIISNPAYHVTDNAVMNALLFRAAYEEQVKHFVFFSCTVMYPGDKKEPVRETDFNYQITDKYFGAGWTKVYNEKMCEFYSKIGSTRFTVIRHSNIYGPFDKFDLERSHVFGATVAKVMAAPERGKVVVWGDGSEQRDLLHVDDLIDFTEQALAHQTTSFELVNVGSGQGISVAELVRKVIEHSGKNLTIEFDRTKPTILFSLKLNLERAKKIFGWSPRISLDEGIKKTLDWYQAVIAPQGLSRSSKENINEGIASPTKSVRKGEAISVPGLLRRPMASSQ